MLNNYDVIIVGGSFAGLSCAQAVARKGLRTIILEKKPWPGMKTHTTGIVVKELAEIWNIPSRLRKKIEKVRIYSPDLNYLDLYSPDYYFYATDTPALIRWQAEKAIQSGVTIRYNSRYQSSEMKDDLHYLHSENLACRYLVGCDGSISRVAKKFSLGQNRQFLLGIEAETGYIEGLPDSHLHVFMDNDIANGYIGWIVPGVGSNQIGLATRYPVKPSLEKFLEKISKLWRLEQTERLSLKSGLIPCGGVVHPFYSKDVLLLGDAAGMVSPLTAGGIHPAVNIGQIAGTLIADYLNFGGNNPGPELEQLIPSYSFKRGLRYLFDHLPLNNHMLNTLFNTRFFQLTAQTIFFHNRGVFSASAWRDIVKLSLNSSVR